MKTKCDVPKFWLDHKDMVYSYIIKRVRDKTLAQDLCQDVLLKIYKFCFDKSGIKNIRSWLFQISHNTIIDHYRKEKKLHILCDSCINIPANTETDIYENLSVYIRPLLVCLPEMYARPLELDLDGIDQKDISKQLNLMLPTTKSRIQRSKLKMKELFFECFYLDLDEAGRINSFEPRPNCLTLQKFIHQQNRFF